MNNSRREAPTTLSLRIAIQLGVEHLTGISPQPRRDAELLLLHAINQDRTYLLTHPEATLTPEQYSHYRVSLERRANHEPIQYIVGEQEFYGLKFTVTPDVLIPRPETEHLVEALLERVPHDQLIKIADIGTGSGAIAVAVTHALPQAQVTALDTSPAALKIAKQNAEANKVSSRIRFLESNLLEAMQTEQFDAIVSNPPYIADSEVLEPQVSNYEPVSALYAGPTGLEIYQRLIPQAHKALKPNGWLLLEIGHGQHDAVQHLLAAWKNVHFVSDLQGIPRVAIARK